MRAQGSARPPHLPGPQSGQSPAEPGIQADLPRQTQCPGQVAREQGVFVSVFSRGTPEGCFSRWPLKVWWPRLPLEGVGEGLATGLRPQIYSLPTVLGALPRGWFRAGPLARKTRMIDAASVPFSCQPALKRISVSPERGVCPAETRMIDATSFPFVPFALEQNLGDVTSQVCRLQVLLGRIDKRVLNKKAVVGLHSERRNRVLRSRRRFARCSRELCPIAEQQSCRRACRKAERRPTEMPLARSSPHLA